MIASCIGEAIKSALPTTLGDCIHVSCQYLSMQSACMPDYQSAVLAHKVQAYKVQAFHGTPDHARSEWTVAGDAQLACTLGAGDARDSNGLSLFACNANLYQQ